VALALILCAGSAEAGRFTVVGRVTFWDKRDHRSDTPGSLLRTATKDTDRPLENLYVELVDQDGSCRDKAAGCKENDDQVLDRAYTDRSTGWFSFDGFDGQGIGNREDIYLRTPMRAGWGQIVNSFGDETWIFSDTRFDFGTGRASGYYRMDWSVSCFRSSQCGRSSLADSKVVRSGVNLHYARATELANVLATAVAAHDQFSYGVLDGPRIDFYVWPEQPGIECNKAYYGDNNAAPDWNSICVKTPFSNHRVGHEIGHVIHRRALDIPEKGLSKCHDGHWWGQKDQYEKCATSEGWANFFGAAIHFETRAVEPFYIKRSRPLEGLIETENPEPLECASQSSNSEESEANVSRFFWDLYDTTTTDDRFADGRYGADNATYDMSRLVGTWRVFERGTADRQTEEDDLDGRNVWDFRAHLPNAHSELYLNCLCNQDKGPVLDRYSCKDAY
jgi:hypothetical protein